MKAPKGQQSGQIHYRPASILSQPFGKTARIIPSNRYIAKDKPLSKRDKHRIAVAQKRPVRKSHSLSVSQQQRIAVRFSPVDRSERSAFADMMSKNTAHMQRYVLPASKRIV